MYGIFWHRPDKRYLLADIVGSRVYRSVRGVEKRVRELDETSDYKPPGGYVVVPVFAPLVDRRFAQIRPDGKVKLTRECPCRWPSVDPVCPFHGKEGA